jgi:hypothetical protein
MELCLLICQLRRGEEGRHTVKGFVVYLLVGTHDAAVGEIFFTRISQSYITNAGGFCYHQAGQNRASVHLPAVQERIWRNRERIEKTRFEDRIAVEHKRAFRALVEVEEEQMVKRRRI